VSACVLDTDVVIAALDRGDAHHQAAVRAITALADQQVPMLLSLINYAEALVRPAEDDRLLRTAVAAMDTLGIRPVPPTASIARRAARLRAANVSLADGFALATAEAHHASMATFDRRVQRAAATEGVPLAAQME